MLHALALLLVAAPRLPDEIRLVDGRTIAGCTIETETLEEVTYRPGERAAKSGEKSTSRALERVAAGDVVDVAYAIRPPAIERGDAAAAAGRTAAAVASFEEYLASVGERAPRDAAWAPGYALARIVELHAAAGDAGGAASAADRLLARKPPARRLPPALLRAADALALAKRPGEALARLDALEALIGEHGLGPRWTHEVALARALHDPALTGDARRARLAEIALAARESAPSAHARAEVALAEAWLAAGELERAAPIFLRVIDAAPAGDPVLAGAWSGLGDCAYRRGEASDDPAAWKEALLAYLRVAVSFPNEARYAARALFHAARAYERLGTDEGKERARTLYLTVRRQYAGSEWAEQARALSRG